MMQIKATALLLFIAMDSPGNLPIFISALQHLEPKRRWRVILREMLFALLILLLFLFSGEALLKLLNLRLETLAISGGLILFLVALRMIFPQPNGALGLPKDEEPFLVPLAMPLIVGPSVLAIVLQQAASYPQHLSQLTSAILYAWATSLLVLLVGNSCSRWLGKKGLSVLERLMGLILLMISIQMMIDGVRTCYMG
ncbi:MAG: YhgN family NAAT transporter [Candidatus Symbiodolus clandestinus]